MSIDVNVLVVFSPIVFQVLLLVPVLLLCWRKKTKKKVSCTSTFQCFFIDTNIYVYTHIYRRSYLIQSLVNVIILHNTNCLFRILFGNLFLYSTHECAFLTVEEKHIIRWILYGKWNSFLFFFFSSAPSHHFLGSI